MAENKRISQNFVSECDAASGARFEVDVEELRVRCLWDDFRWIDM